jgi:S1-C subfamily serine protease
MGGQTHIGIMRGGRESSITIALQAAPDSPREEIVIKSRSPFAGAKVGNLSPALAEELRIDPSAEGVAIMDVANGSPAQRLGFKRGDVIVAVNEQPMARTRDLDRAMREQHRLWRVTVMRDGQRITAQFGG